MNSSPDAQHIQVIVIGGGQAGLAAGHLMKKRGLDLVILDAERRTGDQWRRRWDTLRLFSPAQHDSLPDSPFPSDRGTFPHRDEVAAYLADYAGRFDLPVVHEARVTQVAPRGAAYRVTTTRGTYSADAVVIATGACNLPYVPEFAARIDPRVVQIHSHSYVSADDVPAGSVLVVGYGTSGAEIAEELAASGRDVAIAGKPTASIPDPLLKVAGGAWWLVLNHVLSLKTPVGRKVAPRAAGHGAPLIRVSPKRVRAAGVREVGRIVGVNDGRPALADGSTADSDVIVWCTGYRGDFEWLKVDGLTGFSGPPGDPTTRRPRRPCRCARPPRRSRSRRRRARWSARPRSKSEAIQTWSQARPHDGPHSRAIGPVARPSGSRSSGQTEEQPFEFLGVHPVVLAPVDAVPHRVRDDREAGTVERLGDRGELRWRRVAAIRLGADQADQSVQLSFGSFQAVHDRLHRLGVVGCQLVHRGILAHVVPPS